jgi:hypothetical protein
MRPMTRRKARHQIGETVREGEDELVRIFGISRQTMRHGHTPGQTVLFCNCVKIGRKRKPAWGTWPKRNRSVKISYVSAPFTREAVDAQEARKVKSEYRSAGTMQFKIVPFLV